MFMNRSMIQHFFNKMKPNMSEQKRNYKESTIGLTPKPSQKIPEIIGVSL